MMQEASCNCGPIACYTAYVLATCTDPCKKCDHDTIRKFIMDHWKRMLLALIKRD